MVSFFFFFFRHMNTWEGCLLEMVFPRLSPTPSKKFDSLTYPPCRCIQTTHKAFQITKSLTIQSDKCNQNMGGLGSPTLPKAVECAAPMENPWFRSVRPAPQDDFDSCWKSVSGTWGRQGSGEDGLWGWRSWRLRRKRVTNRGEKQAACLAEEGNLTDDAVLDYLRQQLEPALQI